MLTIPALSKPSPHLVWGFILALSIAAFLYFFAKDQREIGARDIALKQLGSELIKANNNVKVRTDTLVLTRHKTDSIITHDTVFTQKEVRIIVNNERAACDSVITATKSACEIKDSIITQLKKRPSFVARAGKELAKDAIIFLLGRASN